MTSCGFRYLAVVIGVAAMICGTPVAAAGVCDNYPESIGSAKLQRLSLDLKHSFPAEQAETVSRIRLVNSDRTDLLGPRLNTAPGKDPVIEIPRGFQRLQCKLVLLETYYMRNCCNRKVSASQIVLDCYQRDRQLRQCVEKFLDDVMVRLGDRYSGDDPQLVEQLLKAAFQYTLAHEVAHVVTTPDTTRRLATNLDRETAADVLSLLALVSDGQLQIASIAPAAMMSVADAAFDWTEEPHPPSACRAKLANEIVLKIGPEVGQIYLWLLQPETYLHERGKPRRVETLQIFIPGDVTGCRTSGTAAIDRVRGDFDRILAALDAVERAGARASPEEAIKRLMSVRPVTAEGERLLTNVASLWVFKVAKIDAAGNDAASLRRSATRLDSLTAGFKPEFMTAESYGRVLVNRALVHYFNAPPGSSLDAVNARLLEDLDLAERYFTNSGYAKLYRGDVAYMKGRCKEGRDLYSAFLSERTNAGFAPRLNGLIGTAESRGCSVASRELRRETRGRFGWAD